MIKIDPLFFPSKESLNQLIAFLDHAEKLMRICVYTFTNREIVAKILELVKAKPDLRV